MPLSTQGNFSLHRIRKKKKHFEEHIEEMAASRLVRELEQHGYVKRTSRPMPFGGEEKIIQMNW